MQREDGAHSLTSPSSLTKIQERDHKYTYKTYGITDEFNRVCCSSRLLVSPPDRSVILHLFAELYSSPPGNLGGSAP